MTINSDDDKREVEEGRKLELSSGKLMLATRSEISTVNWESMSRTKNINDIILTKTIT